MIIGSLENETYTPTCLTLKVSYPSEECSVDLIRLVRDRLGYEVQLSTCNAMILFDRLARLYGFRKTIEVYRDAGYYIPERLILAKIALAGDSGVGKTSLFRRFCEGVYREDVKSTVSVAFGLRYVVVRNYLVKLIIRDSAGQERFAELRRHFYRGAKVVLLVFDVANRRSFRNLLAWVQEIRESEPNSEIILVGNKIDLERAVPPEEAVRLAATAGCHAYLETSAKTGKGVKEAFYAAAHVALSKALDSGQKPINLC